MEKEERKRGPNERAAVRGEVQSELGPTMSSKIKKNETKKHESVMSP